MLKIRKAQERGKGQLDWLESYHSFSFADYYDPKYMHFSHLRVINEDKIAAERGFTMHPHQDMEILTYVLAGRVAHQDSLGNYTEVKAGEFQIMSAGSGIYHSEINPSSISLLHLYQIWIIPNQKGITPRYEQGKFINQQGATLILSPQGERGSFKVYQDMYLWRYQFRSSQKQQINLNPVRKYWLQVIKGKMDLNDHLLMASDGVAISQEECLSIEIEEDIEFLLFEFVLNS